MNKFWNLMEQKDFDGFLDRSKQFNLSKKNTDHETVLGFLTRLASENADSLYLKYFEHLLLSGANPNVYDNMGRTPLTHLARNDQLQCIKLFEKFGADVNFRAPTGYSPLQEALRVNCAISVSNYLLKHPSLNLDDKCKTALLNSTRRADARKSLALLQEYGIKY